MFTQTWKKYLPVIAILIKRSGSGDQTLNMNNTDFERAAGGRKIKYSFNNMHLNDARIDNTFKHTPLAKEFAQLLQENELTKPLLKKQNLEFSMNSDFQLVIRNHTASADDIETDKAESNKSAEANA
jgi:hypothetical protein